MTTSLKWALAWARVQEFISSGDGSGRLLFDASMRLLLTFGMVAVAFSVVMSLPADVASAFAS
jgi:hypothetical protein